MNTDWAASLAEQVARMDLGSLPGGPPERIRSFQRGLLLSQTLPRPAIGQSPHEIVHRQDKLNVRYYAPAQVHPGRLPVLIVPSLINKAAVCDLEPDRSLVRGLADRGHQVYLLDWGEPTAEDASEGVAYVLLELLQRSVDRVCRHARAPNLHLFGYCQGGTLAAMYAALRPARIGGLAVLNAPVRFAEAGRFSRFVDAQTFDADTQLDADGLLPVALLQSAFRLLDPMGNIDRYVAIDRAKDDPVRLRRVLARERWLEENVPMAGTFAREFIRCAYQQDRLSAGTWDVGGERVDLSNIVCPTFVLAARRDFIAPAGACLPLAAAVSSPDVRVELLDGGHIGVVVGSFGPQVLSPMLGDWFAAHGQAVGEAR
jgi:polyhydroxyalkanoate synthase subunit PhaC